MPKFCANLGFMYSELPFPDRIPAAARAGFKAVEFPYPYDFDRNQINDLVKQHNLVQVTINTPKGGGRGMACDPDRIGEFQDGLRECIEHARLYGTSRIHVLAGDAPEGKPRDLLMRTYRDNVRFAAREFAKHNIRALIEAINNKVDGPRYFMHMPSEALATVRELNEPNLKLDFDFYHVQIMQGNLIPFFKEALPDVGHVQIADTPGRFEPGTGEINYTSIFRMLDEVGYTDWIGAEYKPKGKTTAEGLGWIKPYL
jgi:hydroxypyruvate isomerase